jgi:hypothetical protein
MSSTFVVSFPYLSLRPLFGDIALFHQNILSAVVEFAHTRNVTQPNWNLFSNGDPSEVDEEYFTTLLGAKTELLNSTRADRCALWIEHGLTKFWWQQ